MEKGFQRLHSRPLTRSRTRTTESSDPDSNPRFPEVRSCPETSRKWPAARWSSSAESWKSEKQEGGLGGKRPRPEPLSIRPRGRSSLPRRGRRRRTSHQEVPRLRVRSRLLEGPGPLRARAVPDLLRPPILQVIIISSIQSWNRWQPKERKNFILQKKIWKTLFRKKTVWFCLCGANNSCRCTIEECVDYYRKKIWYHFVNKKFSLEEDVFWNL